MLPRFNCVLEMRTLSCVCVCNTEGKVQNRPRIVEVLFLTNSLKLVTGEELVLEVTEKRKKPEAKRSWRDAMRDEEKEKERSRQR